MWGQYSRYTAKPLAGDVVYSAHRGTSTYRTSDPAAYRVGGDGDIRIGHAARGIFALSGRADAGQDAAAAAVRLAGGVEHLHGVFSGVPAGGIFLRAFDLTAIALAHAGDRASAGGVRAGGGLADCAAARLESAGG